MIIQWSDFVRINEIGRKASWTPLMGIAEKKFPLCSENAELCESRVYKLSNVEWPHFFLKNAL